MAGMEDVVVAGGVENMSRVPMGGNRDVHGVPFGWALANDRPRLVKGVIAIEPSGGPKHDVILTPGQPSFYRDGPIVRAWGVTRTPVTSSP